MLLGKTLTYSLAIISLKVIVADLHSVLRAKMPLLLLCQGTFVGLRMETRSVSLRKGERTVTARGAEVRLSPELDRRSQRRCILLW